MITFDLAPTSGLTMFKIDTVSNSIVLLTVRRIGDLGFKPYLNSKWASALATL